MGREEWSQSKGEGETGLEQGSFWILQLKLEQSKGKGELGLETHQFLEFDAQAGAKLTFCLFLDEAKTTTSSYLSIGF